MKSKTKLALAIIAAFGLGGAVVEGLHAQAKAKPAIYTVAQIDVKNMDAYLKDYAPKARDLISKSGGKTLAASSSPKTIEGKAPAPRIAIQMWENMDQYMAYRNSAAFKEVRAIGGKYATFNTFAVEAGVQ